ncbi:MAG: hypothetical protein JWL77_406 [Chthonomonadaceae bacterium]|nr:hypothetical protein [Chthonomonadaceae bacterium]
MNSSSHGASANTNRSFWICGLVTIASALTSAGFSLAALSSFGTAHTNALYAASRSLPLALACILVVSARSRTGLVALASVMALVQAGDAIIGAINHDPLKTFGPAFTALISVAALGALWKSLSKSPEG